MPEFDSPSLAAYLAEKLFLPAEHFHIRELPGGVSNLVYYVTPQGQAPFVFKQSLARLRVQQEWLCPRERIFREIDALALLGPRAPQGSMPQLLFEDRANFCFAMSAAGLEAPTWKHFLLNGQVDLSLAVQAARLQHLFFTATDLAPHFHGLDLFDQLRLDPYYRITALRHPDLAPHFDRAIALSTGTPSALTHGDWSPKNFLINPGGHLFSIDYEVMHWGEPSFDIAFLLNHFLLKGWHRASAQPLFAALAQAYWSTLSSLLGPTLSSDLAPKTLLHLGCLHLARIDGKSPVEYFNPGTAAQVRRFARDLIQHPPQSIAAVFERQAEAFHE